MINDSDRIGMVALRAPFDGEVPPSTDGPRPAHRLGHVSRHPVVSSALIERVRSSAG